MRPKAVFPRQAAARDIDEAIAHYLEAGSERAALGFIDALERAYRHIGRYPASGSPRYALELGLPGVRVRPLKGYPHLVFYVERDDHIDVWRVLHGERDIPAWLNDPV